MNHEISQKLKAFIVEKFPVARKREIRTDDHLLEKGILDSMGVLDVVGFIEEEFQITVVDEDLSPENFQSIDRLVLFIETKQQVSA